MPGLLAVFDLLFTVVSIGLFSLIGSDTVGGLFSLTGSEREGVSSSADITAMLP